MSVTAINATPGSATANAYVTLVVADQYHLDHPQFGTAVASGLWSAASSDQKTQAILWATKLLDRLFVWEGSVVNSIQGLLWPRNGLVKVNGWDALDYTTIPDQIQWATAEFARQLLVADRTADSDVAIQGISDIKAGSVALSFFQGVGPSSKPVPDVVMELIPREWGHLRGTGTRRLERA